MVSPTITQHLKIWRFNKNEINKIDISAVPLDNLEKTGFHFSSKEAYLVLLVYRANTKEKVDVVSFPHSLWGLVKSADNLTPRGLSNSFSSDDGSTTHTLDSFLLSKRETKEYIKDRDYKYMLFVWNGKEAEAILKACALSRGFELDTLLNKSGDALVSFIFNGGVVRGTRLQRGKVLLFDQASSEQEEKESHENPNTPETESMLKTFETVYLFQFLVPDTYIDELKHKNNITHSSHQKSVIEQTMYPKFRKYFFPESDENAKSDSKEDDNYLQSSYQNRFKFIGDQNSDMEEDQEISDERDNIEERPPPLSNPMPKLAISNNFGGNQLPAQKPAIPLLNIAPQDIKGNKEIDEKDPMSLEQNQNKIPGIKGIALDVEKVSRKSYNEDYDMSSDRIYEDPGEYSSSRASNNPMKGFGLDLSKAKEIQNEILNQASSNNSKIPSLALPGGNLSDRKAPSLGIPVSSGSRSNEEDLSNRAEFEQSTGPQLKINIKNVSKLSEDTEMKDEDLYEPPKHRRGCCEPDPPHSVSSTNDQDEYNTSITEERNNKFRQICSEIIEDFLYLGSDFLAKNKETLKQNKITHIINSAGDYSPNYHDEDFKYMTFHLKDHPRENIE